MCECWAYVALNKATNGQTYKTWNGENTLLNVTVEDHRWKAPSLAKIKFGKCCLCIIIVMKNFNRCNSHGHHGSKRRELAQHSHSMDRIHSLTLYINAVTSMWCEAPAKLLFFKLYMWREMSRFATHWLFGIHPLSQKWVPFILILAFQLNQFLQSFLHEENTFVTLIKSL